MGTRATVGRLERRRHGQRGKHCGRRLRKRGSRRQRAIRVNKQDSDEGGEERGKGGWCSVLRATETNRRRRGEDGWSEY